MTVGSVGRVALHFRRSLMAGLSAYQLRVEEEYELPWLFRLLYGVVTVVLANILWIPGAACLAFALKGAVGFPLSSGLFVVGLALSAWACWCWLCLSTTRLGVRARVASAQVPMPTLPVERSRRAVPVGLLAWVTSLVCPLLCGLICVHEGMGRNLAAAGLLGTFLLVIACAPFLLLPSFIALGFDEGKWRVDPLVLTCLGKDREGVKQPASAGHQAGRRVALCTCVVAPLVAAAGAITSPLLACGYAVLGSIAVLWAVPRMQVRLDRARNRESR